MPYPVISTDLARLRTINGQDAVYIGPVSYHPAYAEEEGQIVTLHDDLGEVEVEAQLIRQRVGENDQWYGIFVSPFRDISEESVPTGKTQDIPSEAQTIN